MLQLGGLALLLLLSTWLLAHPLAERIYDVNAQQWIDQATLVQQLRASPVVLIGEQHDNPDHHLIEQQLVKALATSHPTLVLEMLSEQQTPLLDNAGIAQANPQWCQQLQLDLRGWDSAAYCPIIITALARHQTVVSGNFAKHTLQQFYQSEPAARDDQRLSSRFNVSQATRDRVLESIFAGHCELMPRAQLTPMLNVQLARDALMAYQVSHFSPALLIAGAQHVRKDQGVPQHLASPSISLLLVEVSANQLTPEDYASAQQADYLWFSRAQPEKDYCADLKQRLSQPKTGSTAAP